MVRHLQLLFPFLQFIPDLIWGTRAINDLQRLTVSLRGGFEQRAKCQLFRFTGQLDTYSDKQFV